jgi:hypothetical protein
LSIYSASSSAAAAASAAASSEAESLTEPGRDVLGHGSFLLRRCAERQKASGGHVSERGTPKRHELKAVLHVKEREQRENPKKTLEHFPNPKKKKP